MNSSPSRPQRASIRPGQPRPASRRSGPAPLRLSLLACLLVLAALALPSQAELTLDMAQLKSALNSAQNASSLSPDSRAQLVELYQKAIDNLSAAQQDRAQAQRFVEQLENAPRRAAEIRKQLDSPPAPLRIDQKPLATLEQQLLDQQTELLRLRSELADINAQALAEKESNIAELLSQALDQQAELQGELQTRAPAGTADSEPAEARRLLQLSRIEAAEARITLLRKQLLSRDARLELMALEQRRLNREISSASERASALQAAVNTARQQQAGQVAQRTLDKANRLEQAPEDIKALAAGNAELAGETAEVSRQTDTLLQQIDKLRQDHSRLDRYFSSISQQLAVSGADRLAILGVELRSQRHQLAQRQRLSVDPRVLREALTRAQLRQLQLQDRLYDSSSTGSDGLKAELAAERAELLQDGVQAYQRYIDTLNTTLSENAALQSRFLEYRNLLDSRLFWIPSSPPLSLQALAATDQELRWLLDPAQWQPLRGAVAAAPGLRSGLLLLLAAALLVAQRRLKHLLRQQAKNIGKVNRDRVSRTFLTLALSLLLALPGPLLLVALARLLGSTAPFAALLQQGLNNAAGLWFLLNVFLQICRPGGLAEAHFRWPVQALTIVRRHLTWLAGVLVPVTLLTPLASNTEEQFDAISRMLFSLASLALSYAAHRVLRPFLQAGGTARWQLLGRYLLHPLAVFLPLLLMAMSWLGYHYTALEVESKLFTTACLLAALLVMYYLGLRAVAVIERRMALDRLRARRSSERAHHANRQAADDAAEGMPDSIAPTEYDMMTINRQSRAFLGMVVTLIGVFLLWDIWADLLPAAGLLNDITLWHIRAEEPGQADHAITLANLLLSLALGALTYFGARNLPGALEISVLRSLEIDAGTRYAITTTLKYLIVMLGLSVALNILGAQWSKLQWLVAALGVGLGFGLQEIVANFISGLLILFERPIRVGDTVTVGSHTGTVTRIRIRATVLTDWDRKEQIIPNKTFITEQLTNWTLSDSITRQIIQVGVAYGSDVGQVHQVLSQVVADSKRVIAEPPPAVFFVGFGDSSLNFEIRVFVQNMLDIMPLIHELHVAIEAELRRHGIEIPFPQRDIWIRSKGSGPALDAEAETE